MITGAIHWTKGPSTRLKVGTAALTLGMAPLGLVDAVWLMGALLFLAGFAIAPSLIATLSLVEQTVPSARLTEGMSFIHTGLAAGLAPGAALERRGGGRGRCRPRRTSCRSRRVWSRLLAAQTLPRRR